MRPSRIAGLLGTLLVFVGLSMLLPAGVSALYAEWSSLLSFALALTATIGVGGLLRLVGRSTSSTIFRREALAVVALGWAATGVFGALPYLFDGVFESPVDAWFESVSGFTTTGATVLREIEGAMGYGMHFWRCFTHWLGGMGIVVLFVAIFPQMGVGAKFLFKSEVPGPITEGLRPKIRETSRVLYRIYVGLTLLCMTLLVIAGMSPFDAACHAMSTLGTGGFSTLNASVAGFDSIAIELIITLFMLLAGVNFGLYFLALRGGYRRAVRDRELWTYLGIAAGVTIVIALCLVGRAAPGHPGGPPRDLLEAFRYAVFQVVAILSTTGFVTDDFDGYTNMARGTFFLLFFLGGMAGSTAGGLKTIRIMILLRGGLSEVVREFRPQVVQAVKIGQRGIDPDTVRAVFVFFAVYMAIFIASSMAMATMTSDLVSAGSSVIACLSNVGPALSEYGAVESYAHTPVHGKLLLSGLMIVGRLEVFTILTLFVPSFWRR